MRASISSYEPDTTRLTFKPQVMRTFHLSIKIQIFSLWFGHSINFIIYKQMKEKQSLTDKNIQVHQPSAVFHYQTSRVFRSVALGLNRSSGELKSHNRTPAVGIGMLVGNTSRDKKRVFIFISKGDQ
jgi:hypothetical protein